MKYLNNIITIDPGLEQTSYACWNGELLPVFGSLPSYRKIKSVCERILFLKENLKELLMKFDKTKYVVCEDQFISFSSGKYYTSAVRGDILKLSRLCENYRMLCYDMGIKFESIAPRAWKGDLTKEQVQSRIHRVIAVKCKTHNEYDAVGIGLSLMGVL